MDKLSYKFLVNLHCIYEHKLRVYFLLDVCLSGELFTIVYEFKSGAATIKAI